ncbi:DUF2274 domain-containing protein [Palleronia abyssalis]|uniref:DUF2274 domain-containing protein n=1 Tax=Palleronia abyssalis TaxID=1501240 RepID=A0A2R8BQZ3_9RHOB|nr:DUF2274 domain-containing protein [Palleronia abyssalis]SPJ22506.1 hypothetical protein PAA8504_00300 [Palleronia abyssalis]
MTRLKLGPLVDETPVKLTIEVPAAVHRDLIAYAELLARETGKTIEPAKIVAPMLARFMATDRGFAKLRRAPSGSSGTPSATSRKDQADSG